MNIPGLRQLRSLLLIAMLGFAGMACAADSAIHNVRGFLPDLHFTLEGAGNKTITQANFKGKTVVLFFGYASCPDICPTTMVQLSQVMHELGPEAKNVRILFVSVDPHRDTPDKLQAYVDAFDKHAIAETKRLTNLADLPPDSEIEPEWNAFMTSLARPATQARIKKLFERGFHKPGDVESRLTYHTGQLGR